MTIQTQQRRSETLSDPQTLVDRYVSMWMETDADMRRTRIRELWTENAVHVLEPPREMRQAAAALGFVSPTLEVRGYAALEARVTRAHQEFVAAGRFVFRSRGNVTRLHDVVKFNWEMVPADGGAVAGVGLEVIMVDADDRIMMDYQFIEAVQ
jgi:hypothetical protein